MESPALVHEFMATRGNLCRGCGQPREHKCHELPSVMITMTPLNGGGADLPPFAITIKDGVSLIARVYVEPADFALALAGRMVIGKLAPRYKAPQGDQRDED